MSGHYINQQWARDSSITLRPVPRDKSGGDKLSRFLNTVPYFAQDRIKFPRGHEHEDHVRREVLGLTSMGSGTGKYDVLDNISDAVVLAFSKKRTNYNNWI